MICPRCKSVISFRKDQCDNCGEDLRLQKKIQGASNGYYNYALAKAKVRDLSGSIELLKKSLQLNKKNTQARNLLGLIYFEMGESTLAMSQWQISQQYQEQANEAVKYLECLKKNVTKMDAMNQAVKKYNTALDSVRSGNEDLAVIQLKKVISMVPNYVRAAHLLALLYIKSGEKEKAAKVLYRIKKVDVNNTTTLCYLNEIDMPAEPAGKKKEAMAASSSQTHEIFRETDKLNPISSYKEDRPSPLPWLSLFFGLILGVVVTWYLIVPEVQKYRESEEVSELEMYVKQSEKQESTISILEEEIDELNQQLTDAQDTITDWENKEVFDPAMYDDLFDAVSLYTDGEHLKAAKKLVSMNVKLLPSEAAKSVYKYIKKATFSEASTQIYQQGWQEYTDYKYEDAKKTLLEALEYDSNNVDALYFLGRSYDQLNNTKKAKYYYNKIIKDFPDTTRAVEASQKLRAIQE